MIRKIGKKELPSVETEKLLPKSLKKELDRVNRYANKNFPKEPPKSSIASIKNRVTYPYTKIFPQAVTGQF